MLQVPTQEMNKVPNPCIKALLTHCIHRSMQISFLSKSLIKLLPDSDSSTFLVFGAGEGDSLFSILLCLGAEKRKVTTEL